jgi:hypothetical protein
MAKNNSQKKALLKSVVRASGAAKALGTAKRLNLPSNPVNATPANPSMGMKSVLNRTIDAPRMPRLTKPQLETNGNALDAAASAARGMSRQYAPQPVKRPDFSGIAEKAKGILKQSPYVPSYSPKVDRPRWDKKSFTS